MPLRLYYQPLSFFCWKALIALYENDTAFEPVLANLGKSPVLIDDGRQNRVIPEATLIIEYLARHYPGQSTLVPDDADLAKKARTLDRFFDLNISIHVHKAIGDSLRNTGEHDLKGVEYARGQIRSAYGTIDQDMASKRWAMGDNFTMADCSAAPALFYGNMVAPITDQFPNVAAYLERLKQRPSFARVLKEAEPHFAKS